MQCIHEMQIERFIVVPNAYYLWYGQRWFGLVIDYANSCLICFNCVNQNISFHLLEMHNTVAIHVPNIQHVFKNTSYFNECDICYIKWQKTFRIDEQWKKNEMGALGLH